MQALVQIRSAKRRNGATVIHCRKVSNKNNGDSNDDCDSDYWVYLLCRKYFTHSTLYT